MYKIVYIYMYKIVYIYVCESDVQKQIELNTK